MSIWDILSYGGGVTLGKPRPNLTEIITDPLSELHSRFGNYDYSITISPKSSKRLMKSDMSPHPIDKQYTIIYSYMKELLNKYNCRYSIFFELYADGENLHIHGCIKPAKLKDIPKIKRDIYLYFMKLDKAPKGVRYSPLIDLSQINSTIDWFRYCLKSQPYILSKEFYPLKSL